MKRKKIKGFKCPCCQIHRHETEMKDAIGILEKIEKKNHPRIKNLNIIGFFKDAQFEWACDECLSLKKAMTANPSAQIYSWHPHISYFDEKKNCQFCKKDFYFSKNEKRFWYEQLKFQLDATPANCPTCRKEKRNKKQIHDNLSEYLKNGKENLDYATLENIIQIYRIWDKEDKVKYYQSLLKNKNPKKK